MKTSLTLFNALGVAALVAVSIFQWRDSGALRHRRDELDARAAALDKKLAGTAASLDSANVMLDEFRTRNEVLDADNTRLLKNLRDAETLSAARAIDVARLETNVAVWKKALAGRDQTIVTLNGSLKDQAASRNEATERYNELVAKYNDLAKRTAEAERLVFAARAERDKALELLKAAVAVNNT